VAQNEPKYPPYGLNQAKADKTSSKTEELIEPEELREHSGEKQDLKSNQELQSLYSISLPKTN